MRARGFTLLEVLAVIVATSVVLGVALAIYVGVSRQNTHASESMRETRRAAAVLDYVARDLERVVLVEAPAETDPLGHPWIFLAESRRGSDGADHLKFVTRGHAPRLSGSPESDLEVVGYALREGEAGDFELWRSAAPRLPEIQDRSYPDPDQPGTMLLAGGLSEFGVAFLDELGEEISSWDSSSLVQAGQLPLAARIFVALRPPDEGEEVAAVEPTVYQREVLLPLRPLDFDELLDPNSAVGGGKNRAGGDDQASDDDEDQGSGSGVCEEGPCASLSVCQAIDCASDYGPSIAKLLGEIGGQPFCRWRGRLPNSVGFLIRNPACR